MTSTDSSDQYDQLEKIMDSHAAALCEHFDSVIIFATYRRGQNSSYLTRGRGCYYSQYGSVRDWIIRQDEDTKQDARKNSE